MLTLAFFIFYQYVCKTYIGSACFHFHLLSDTITKELLVCLYGFFYILVCSVEDIQNGAVQLSDDMLTAYYSCDTGFSLKGQQTRTCLSNGLGWDQELPVCGM